MKTYCKTVAVVFYYICAFNEVNHIRGCALLKMSVSITSIIFLMFSAPLCILLCYYIWILLDETDNKSQHCHGFTSQTTECEKKRL